MRDALCQCTRHVIRRIFRENWQDMLAILVGATNDLGPPPVGQTVECTFQLAFGELVFLLDDKNFL